MSQNKDNKDGDAGEMDKNVSLLMRVIKINQGLKVQNWDTIASEEGLSVATAKQRFGALKTQFLSTNSAPVAPIIKRRKRGAPAQAVEEEEEREEEPIRVIKKPKLANGRTPLPTLEDKRRAEAARARDAHRQAFQARERAVRREWGLPVEGDEEDGEERVEKEDK